MTSKLPTVSYLTVFDKYILSALLFLVILCVWHALIGSRLFLFPDPARRIAIDFMALYTIAGVYVAFHTAYIPYFLSKLLRHSKVGKEAAENARIKEVLAAANAIELQPLVNEMTQSTAKTSKTPPNTRVSFNPPQGLPNQSARNINAPNTPQQQRNNSLIPGAPGAPRPGNSPQPMRSNNAAAQLAGSSPIPPQKAMPRKSLA